MKLYSADTIIGFGKYKGKKINSILSSDPNYLMWCLENLDHFILDDDTFHSLPSIIESKLKRVEISTDGRKVWGTTYNSHKLVKIYNSKKEKYDELKSKDEYNPIYGDESYGNYSGTYAQDVAGLSDNFIDDVLGGEPEAYWNID
tara:strand:+ start:117 stop:551 length:435 start_codon:yes stop_codon:yes gene_type:complete